MTMTDESTIPDWLPPPPIWPQWMPNALGNGGLLPPAASEIPARIAFDWEEGPNGGLTGRPNQLWNSRWWESIPSVPAAGGNGGVLGSLPAQPAGPPWFDPGPQLNGVVAGSPTLPQVAPAWPAGDDAYARAAARVRQSVQPQGGRREGIATKLLEHYLSHVAEGLADLITLPGRQPVPMPKGMTITDTGKLLVDGRPAAETAEGRAWLEDQQKRIDWGPAMALNMLTLGRTPGAAPRGAIGTFVGQKGAERLTEGGLHPAVDPKTALTDRDAISTLEARAQSGDLRDADVFARSGWFRGVDGMLRKEIPDTGARLVPTGKDKFIWQHPAGDIHQVYDIPPITIGTRVARHYGPGATTDPNTGRIYIAADPTTPGGLDYANRVIAEEIQHAIQAKERFAFGTNPKDEVFFPDYWKALGRPFPSGPEAPQIFREHREIIRQGEELGKKETPEYKAAIATYERVAGEAEAHNVLRRLFERLYSQHPHATTKVPLRDQIVRDPDLQRRIVDEAYRRGLFNPPWR
jgi:hypothetical protein